VHSPNSTQQLQHTHIGLQQRRLPKVIWEQAASPPLAADPLITAAYNRSTAFARWRRCDDTRVHPTHYPKRQLDRFSRFCTANAAFSLYVTLRRTISLQNLPFLVSDLDPYLKHYAYPTHLPKRHLARPCRFFTIHARYQRTDRPTDRTTTELDPVRIGRYATERQGLKMSLIYTLIQLMCFVSFQINELNIKVNDVKGKL